MRNRWSEIFRYLTVFVVVTNLVFLCLVELEHNRHAKEADKAFWARQREINRMQEENERMRYEAWRLECERCGK